MTAGALKLSIVIPSHDTLELTLRCLESIDRASTDAEIVLVDDASTDGTAEIVAQRHPSVQVLRSPQPIGFTKAANLGLRQARGDVLLLLNSDTEVDADGLQAMLSAFATHPRLGAAGAMLHYPDGSPQWSGGKAPSLPWLFALASGLAAGLARLPKYRRLKPLGVSPDKIEWVTGAAMALRRTAWNEIGPFDEGFRFYGQDLDLCLRLSQGGWQIALVPELRVLHHQGATIRGQPGTGGGRQHPGLLWNDLLHWARKHHGHGWARWAALSLGLGGFLRLLARALAAPLQPAREKREFREQSAALREALRSLIRQTWTAGGTR